MVVQISVYLKLDSNVSSFQTDLFVLQYVEMDFEFKEKIVMMEALLVIEKVVVIIA